MDIFIPCKICGKSYSSLCEQNQPTCWPDKQEDNISVEESNETT